MFWDLLFLLLGFIALVSGYVRGAVKVVPGFFQGPLSLFGFALLIPFFMGQMLTTPLFIKNGPHLGWAVLLGLALLFLTVSIAGRLLGKGMGKLLDLFLADEVYRFFGALISFGGLWLWLGSAHLVLVRVFPQWAPQPRGHFQEWVVVLSTALGGR